ncbi:uncharacterized protein LOC133906884 [Phragmites australis]|uniref:uncharacterized protein LOC133906884 n=1 Tax=Phragmites australis TaxID=29695 RepID=UPI002D79B43E|nr:uncharacterized protein LOC133906884 [Phragmites australis]
MQRLSLGSPPARPCALEEEPEDEKAAKALVREPVPDKSIHFIPVLTLLCFLVLFLLSRDPSSSAVTDLPVLAAATRSLEVTGGSEATGRRSGGVYRRLKEEDATQPQGRGRGRRLGMGQRGR